VHLELPHRAAARGRRARGDSTGARLRRRTSLHAREPRIDGDRRLAFGLALASSETSVPTSAGGWRTPDKRRPDALDGGSRHPTGRASSARSPRLAPRPPPVPKPPPLAKLVLPFHAVSRRIRLAHRAPWVPKPLAVVASGANSVTSVLTANFLNVVLLRRPFRRMHRRGAGRMGL
jgi:hypothetical protein